MARILSASISGPSSRAWWTVTRRSWCSRMTCAWTRARTCGCWATDCRNSFTRVSTPQTSTSACSLPTPWTWSGTASATPAPRCWPRRARWPSWEVCSPPSSAAGSLGKCKNSATLHPLKPPFHCVYKFHPHSTQRMCQIKITGCACVNLCNYFIC